MLSTQNRKKKQQKNNHYLEFTWIDHPSQNSSLHQFFHANSERISLANNSKICTDSFSVPCKVLVAKKTKLALCCRAWLDIYSPRMAAHSSSQAILIVTLMSLCRHRTEVEYQNRSQTYSKVSLQMEMRTATVSIEGFWTENHSGSETFLKDSIAQIFPPSLKMNAFPRAALTTKAWGVRFPNTYPISGHLQNEQYNISCRLNINNNAQMRPKRGHTNYFAPYKRQAHTSTSH